MSLQISVTATDVEQLLENPDTESLTVSVKVVGEALTAPEETTPLALESDPTFGLMLRLVPPSVA